MNTVSSLTKNLLFLSQNSQDNELLKLCVQFIKHYKLVLLLTSCSEDILHLIKDTSLDRNQMECIVIIEADNMKDFTEKCLELQNWEWLPTLVLIDLRSIIDKLSDELELIRTVNNVLQDPNSTEVALKPLSFFQQLALLIASLIEFNDCIFKKSAQNSSLYKDLSCFTVLILKEHSIHLTYDQIELLINLYYYANNAFQEEELMNMIEMIKINL